jgi:hypothetical protein
MPKTINRITSAENFRRAVAGFSTDLFGRWEDEQEFEDIADYHEVFKAIGRACPKVEVIKTLSDPMRVVFTVPQGRYALYQNPRSRNIAFRRVFLGDEL